MRCTLLILALVLGPVLYGQSYTAADTESLVASGTALTVQHSVSSVKNVTSVQLYVNCHANATAACVVFLERTGTPATATPIVPQPNVSTYVPSEAMAFKNSDVGVGRVLGPPGGFVIPAGSYLTWSQTDCALPAGHADSVSLRVAPMTGGIDLQIKYKEN